MKLRRILVWGLLVIFAFMPLSCKTHSNSDSYVHSDDPLVGPTTIRFVPGSYATIQAAIQAAERGDIVWVAAGVYAENIEIKEKDLSLRGDGAGQTILQGSVRIIDSGQTSFEGFTVQGGGIYAQNSLIGISGNAILASPGIGLLLVHCPSFVAQGNDIRQSAGEGIVLDDSDGVLGANSVMHGGADGIVVNNAGPTLLGNHVAFNRGDGISIRSFMQYAAPLLLENTISDSGIGDYDIVCFGNANPTGSGNVMTTCANCNECRNLGDPVTYDEDK